MYEDRRSREARYRQIDEPKRLSALRGRKDSTVYGKTNWSKMRSMGTSERGSLNAIDERRPLPRTVQDYLPYLPAERHDCTAAQPKNARHSRYTAGHDEPIHHSAQDELADLHECWTFEDVADRVEVLVLRVLDEPHCSGTHDTSASREKDRKLVPGTKQKPIEFAEGC